MQWGWYRAQLVLARDLAHGSIYQRGRTHKGLSVGAGNWICDTPVPLRPDFPLLSQIPPSFFSLLSSFAVTHSLPLSSHHYLRWLSASGSTLHEHTQTCPDSHTQARRHERICSPRSGADSSHYVILTFKSVG